MFPFNKAIVLGLVVAIVGIIVSCVLSRGTHPDFQSPTFWPMVISLFVTGFVTAPVLKMVKGKSYQTKKPSKAKRRSR